MFDLDHFKSINDTFGHDMGDLVLSKIAEVISQNIRNTDIFARWGGEEFMIVLPHTKIKSAFALAEKIRIQIQEYKFSMNRQVTLSLGVTTYIAYESKEILFKRLDEALYQAKKTGRTK